MKIFLTTILNLSLFIACTSSDMNSDKANKLYELANQDKAIFLDVREKSELSEGVVEGTYWLSMSSILSKPSELLTKINKEAQGKKVFVYCAAGGRAQRVTNTLKEAGIDAENIGGFSDLKKATLPTSNKVKKL